MRVCIRNIVKTYLSRVCKLKKLICEWGLKEISHYIISMALDQYLKKFSTKDKTAANYIKIGDAELNVFGNKYHITNDNLNEFYENYKNMCLKTTKKLTS